MAGLDTVLPQGVPVFLDRERSLLYDLSAFAYLEREYDAVEIEVPATTREVVLDGKGKAVLDKDKNPLFHDVPNPNGEMVKISGVDAAMHKLQQDSFVAIVHFLYAGLKHEHAPGVGNLPAGRYFPEELSPAMIERMVSPGMVAGLEGPLTEALRRSSARPTQAPSVVAAPTEQTDGTGPTSTTSAPSSLGEVRPNSGE